MGYSGQEQLWLPCRHIDVGGAEVIEALCIPVKRIGFRRRRVGRTRCCLHKMLLDAPAGAQKAGKGDSAVYVSQRTAGLSRNFMVQNRIGYSQSLVISIRQEPQPTPGPTPGDLGKAMTCMRGLMEPQGY